MVSMGMAMAEFLLKCVEETVNKTLPEEVEYLKRYDLLNDFIKNHIDIPNHLADLLIRSLTQNKGTLSKRAQEKEFEKLTSSKIRAMETRYVEYFG